MAARSVTTWSSQSLDHYWGAALRPIPVPYIMHILQRVLLHKIPLDHVLSDLTVDSIVRMYPEFRFWDSLGFQLRQVEFEAFYEVQLSMQSQP